MFQDASIAHRFHVMREKHPEKFNSRYVCLLVNENADTSGTHPSRLDEIQQFIRCEQNYRFTVNQSVQDSSSTLRHVPSGIKSHVWLIDLMAGHFQTLLNSSVLRLRFMRLLWAVSSFVLCNKTSWGASDYRDVIWHLCFLLIPSVPRPITCFTLMIMKPLRGLS